MLENLKSHKVTSEVVYNINDRILSGKQLQDIAEENIGRLVDEIVKKLEISWVDVPRVKLQLFQLFTDETLTNELHKLAETYNLIYKIRDEEFEPDIFSVVGNGYE